jgi:hypothetical protein
MPNKLYIIVAPTRMMILFFKRVGPPATVAA